MAELSREEFLRLQKEASERLLQMQRRSEEAIGKIPAPDFVQLRQEKSDPPPPKKQQKPQKQGGFDLLRLFNFNNISLDSDRVLIIAVLLLLMSESSDELLLFALIYIML